MATLTRSPDQRLVGLPDDPPLLSLRFGLEAGGVQFDLVRPVRHRYVDRVDGEQTRALVVVPPVALNLPQEVVLFPNGGARKVEIRSARGCAEGGGRCAAGAGCGMERRSGFAAIRPGAGRRSSSRWPSK